MGGAYRRAPGDSLQPIADDIKAIAARARRNELPSGTSLSNLVEQVKTAIVGISAQVAAAVAALPSISVAGNVTSTGGNFTAPAGAVIAGQYLYAADVYATSAPGFNITGGRVAGWWETATGRAGTAVSSRRFKDNIVPVDLEHARGILAVGIYYWNYSAEIRKRDDPDYEDYVGPHYHVGTNVGPIAEDLHAAGLWEYVIYERDTIYEVQTNEAGEEVRVVVGQPLRLDDRGEPIPLGIHDSLMAYAVIPVVQDHDERLERIEHHLGLGNNS